MSMHSIVRLPLPSFCSLKSEQWCLATCSQCVLHFVHRYGERRMPRGSVKWFDDRKGYGFIAREGGKDIFVHFSAIQGNGVNTLSEGEVGDVELVNGPNGEQATKGQSRMWEATSG